MRITAIAAAILVTVLGPAGFVSAQDADEASVSPRDRALNHLANAAAHNDAEGELLTEAEETAEVLADRVEIDRARLSELRRQARAAAREVNETSIHAKRIRDLTGQGIASEEEGWNTAETVLNVATGGAGATLLALGGFRAKAKRWPWQDAAQAGGGAARSTAIPRTQTGSIDFAAVEQEAAAEEAEEQRRVESRKRWAKLRNSENGQNANEPQRT